MSKPENPSASPFDQWEDNNFKQHPGMTLRDYFAAKAMQGLMSRVAAQGDQLADQCQGQPEVVAEWSYRISDAMLKQRKR